VLAAAVRLADKEGAEALTMRRLAQKLGVEAMSLYHHVADKDDILDGMVELVFGEIELPDGLDWRSAMRRRAGSLRQALVRHPWAVALLDSRRNAGAETLRHQDWMIGTLLGAGFSIGLVAHAQALLDSYIYGFAVQEVGLPFSTREELEEVVDQMAEQLPAEIYPNLATMVREHIMKTDYTFGGEFDFGLELILDGLDRARGAEAGERG